MVILSFKLCLFVHGSDKEIVCGRFTSFSSVCGVNACYVLFVFLLHCNILPHLLRSQNCLASCQVGIFFDSYEVKKPVGRSFAQTLTQVFHLPHCRFFWAYFSELLFLSLYNYTSQFMLHWMVINFSNATSAMELRKAKNLCFIYLCFSFPFDFFCHLLLALQGWMLKWPNNFYIIKYLWESVVFLERCNISIHHSIE